MRLGKTVYKCSGKVPAGKHTFTFMFRHYWGGRFLVVLLFYQSSAPKGAVDFFGFCPFYRSSAPNGAV